MQLDILGPRRGGDGDARRREVWRRVRIPEEENPLPHHCTTTTLEKRRSHPRRPLIERAARRRALPLGG